MSSIHDANRELVGGIFKRQALVGLKKGSSLDMFERGRTWERGSVSSVFPETHTCNIRTDRGSLYTGVAWPGGHREIDPPYVGEACFIHNEAGVPMMMRAPSTIQLPPAPKDATSFLPGAVASVQIPTALTGTLNNQPRMSGSAPSDVLPGDWMRRSGDGNYIGVLSGGVNVMRSGEFAQIQTIDNTETEGDETVNIIGRTIRMFTGVGTLLFSTEPSRSPDGKPLKGKGKTSMVFTLGADEETESSPNEEFFRVRAALGQAGNLANFRITDAKGRNAYSMQIFPTGDTEIKQRSEVRTVDLGWKLLCESFNLKATKDSRIETDGSLDLNAGGSLRARSFGRLSLRAVGGNASLRSSRSVNINSGSTMSVTANGPLIPFIPFLARSMDIVATNGSVVYDIGSPLSGDFQLTQSGFRVNVGSALGSIRFSTALTPGGGFIVDCTTPFGVKLGGPPLAPHPSPLDPGVDSAVLATPLLSLLANMAIMFDAHVHASTDGPTTPPLNPVMSASVGAAAAIIPSKFVRFGG
jgi:hypothetical protein